MFKSFAFNYSGLRACDLFDANSIGPIGGCIRIGETGNVKSLFDRTIPNHSGIITEDHKQLFATEVSGNGVKNNSLEQYTSHTNQIIAVWRHPYFDVPENRESAQEYLALWRRRHADEGYDLFGAIAASPWVRKLCPWIKPDPNKEYCSEDVYSFLVNRGFAFPIEWAKNAPNPLQLRDWNAAHGWVKVPEVLWKVITVDVKSPAPVLSVPS